MSLNLGDLTKIRTVFDDKNGQYYFSVVDTIGILTKSSDPQNYWKVLKNRLKKTHNELVTSCNQLKMKSADGKYYFTDTADGEVLLRLVKAVSSEHLPIFQTWLDKLDDKSTKEKLGMDTSYPQQDIELEAKVDAYRENNFFIVQCFVAGVEEENILITTTSSTLIIRGQRKPTWTSDVQVGKGELSWGKFSRTIPLPEEVEINLVEAKMEHGLLTIKLPIIDKTRERIVKVKTIN